MNDDKQFEMILKHSVLMAEDGERESWFGDSRMSVPLDTTECATVKDVAIAALKRIKNCLLQQDPLHITLFVSETVEYGEGYAYVKVRYHESNRDSESMLSGYVVCPSSLPVMPPNDIISVVESERKENC